MSTRDRPCSSNEKTMGGIPHGLCRSRDARQLTRRQRLSGSTPEQEEILAVSDRFAQAEFWPLQQRMDDEEWWPPEAMPALARMGFLGVTAPTQLGGAGGDFFTSGLITQGLARWNPAIALSYVAHENLCLNNIARNGSDEIRTRFLPRLCDGSAIGALGTHRAGRRLRRARIDEHDGAARRRPLRAQRSQALHHQRSGRRRRAGLCQDRQVAGRQGHLGLHRRTRHGRLRGRPEARQDGLSRQHHGRAGVRRLPRARREPRRRQKMPASPS